MHNNIEEENQSLLEQNLMRMMKIELSVGRYASRRTIQPGFKIHHIPEERIPAAQLLQQLNCWLNGERDLSTYQEGNQLSEQSISAVDGNIIIEDFTDSAQHRFYIDRKRVSNLLNNAKLYLNTEILSRAQYEEILKCDTGLKEHDYHRSVAVCHAQEIYLLVEQHLEKDGDTEELLAFSSPRHIPIDDHRLDPLLLLTSPALNDYQPTALSAAKKSRYMLAFYSNLFDAAISEGSQCIVMPAAGLGAFGCGEVLASCYFKVLMQAASEYSNQLIIFYNPRKKYSELFDRIKMAKGNPDNIIKTEKDTVFLANALNEGGFKTALHNPSDAEVVYGKMDIGMYWKSLDEHLTAGEEYIGKMTTAPINSYGLNPESYHKIIARNLYQQKTRWQVLFLTCLTTVGFSGLFTSLAYGLMHDNGHSAVAVFGLYLFFVCIGSISQEYQHYQHDNSKPFHALNIFAYTIATLGSISMVLVYGSRQWFPNLFYHTFISSKLLLYVPSALFLGTTFIMMVSTIISVWNESKIKKMSKIIPVIAYMASTIFLCIGIWQKNELIHHTLLETKTMSFISITFFALGVLLFLIDSIREYKHASGDINKPLDSSIDADSVESELTSNAIMHCG